MEGRYIYCVAEGGEELSLGGIGIEGTRVYTVAFNGLSAVVHNAPADLPDCRNREKVIDWVVAHQEVVDMAWHMFGTVIPIRFHTVIKEGTEGVKGWLAGNHGELLKKIGLMKGREEYGLQLFWNTDLVAGRLMEGVQALKELKAKGEGGSGAAYMHGQLLQKALKREMEREAVRFFEDIYERVKDLAERIIIEEVKATDSGLQMIMNLSVLLRTERCDDMKEELEIVDRMEGIAVRHTGPWPPYSFVDR